MGTRVTQENSGGYNKDHPHAYGDKQGATFSDGTKPGSSPRVWGQDKYFMQWASETRIIPTRMGTSQRIFTLSALREDHPHAYGDKSSSTR